MGPFLKRKPEDNINSRDIKYQTNWKHFSLGLSLSLCLSLSPYLYLDENPSRYSFIQTYVYNVTINIYINILNRYRHGAKRHESIHTNRTKNHISSSIYIHIHRPAIYGLVFLFVYCCSVYPFVVRRPDAIDNFAAKLQEPIANEYTK